MLSTFTFYYIYIKTISVEIDKLLNKRFTFYYIYIKTSFQSFITAQKKRFTFYYIYIKTTVIREQVTPT